MSAHFGTRAIDLKPVPMLSWTGLDLSHELGYDHVHIGMQISRVPQHDRFYLRREKLPNFKTRSCMQRLLVGLFRMCRSSGSSRSVRTFGDVGKQSWTAMRWASTEFLNSHIECPVDKMQLRIFMRHGSSGPTFLLPTINCTSDFALFCDSQPPAKLFGPWRADSLLNM